MEVLDFEKLKTGLHGTLLSRIDLEKLSSVDDGKARRAVATMIQEIVGTQKIPLNAAEKERVENDLLDEVFGLGPLEPLLRDPTVSDILVNNRNVVYVERRGILEKTSAKFRDDRHLMQVIDRIVSRVGRRVDESSPMVDAQASRRLASERDHSAAGARRSLHVHPPFRQRARRRRTLW